MCEDSDTGWYDDPQKHVPPSALVVGFRYISKAQFGTVLSGQIIHSKAFDRYESYNNKLLE